MTRLRHYDNSGTARFVTFSCFRRYPYLAVDRFILPVIEQLQNLRKSYGVSIHGYVIMPDHVHLVLTPPERTKLGVVIGQLKARSSRMILSMLREGNYSGMNTLIRNNGQAAVWQRRCYDHNCRTAEIVVEKIRYCHNNPVSSGLVSRSEDWRWSSYRWYFGERDGAVTIDAVDL